MHVRDISNYPIGNITLDNKLLAWEIKHVYDVKCRILKF